MAIDYSDDSIAGLNKRRAALSGGGGPLEMMDQQLQMQGRQAGFDLAEGFRRQEEQAAQESASKRLSALQSTRGLSNRQLAAAQGDIAADAAKSGVSMSLDTPGGLSARQSVANAGRMADIADTSRRYNTDNTFRQQQFDLGTDFMNQRNKLRLAAGFEDGGEVGLRRAYFLGGVFSPKAKTPSAYDMMREREAAAEQARRATMNSISAENRPSAPVVAPAAPARVAPAAPAVQEVDAGLVELGRRPGYFGATPAPKVQARKNGGELGVDLRGFIKGPGGVDNVPARIQETGERILVSAGERIVNKKQNRALEQLVKKETGKSLDAFLEKATGHKVGPSMKEDVQALNKGGYVDDYGRLIDDGRFKNQYSKAVLDQQRERAGQSGAQAAHYARATAAGQDPHPFSKAEQAGDERPRRNAGKINEKLYYIDEDGRIKPRTRGAGNTEAGATAQRAELDEAGKGKNVRTSLRAPDQPWYEQNMKQMGDKAKRFMPSMATVNKGAKFFGPLAAGAQGVMDAANVVGVANHKDAQPLDAWTEAAGKAGRWGTAGLGAAAGTAMAGPIGTVLGGAAGYFGGDAVIKGLRHLTGQDTRDPSERLREQDIAAAQAKAEAQPQQGEADADDMRNAADKQLREREKLIQMTTKPEVDPSAELMGKQVAYLKNAGAGAYTSRDGRAVDPAELDAATGFRVLRGSANGNQTVTVAGRDKNGQLIISGGSTGDPEKARAAEADRIFAQTARDKMAASRMEARRLMSSGDMNDMVEGAALQHQMDKAEYYDALDKQNARVQSNADRTHALKAREVDAMYGIRDATLRGQQAEREALRAERTQKAASEYLKGTFVTPKTDNDGNVSYVEDPVAMRDFAAQAAKDGVDPYSMDRAELAAYTDNYRKLRAGMDRMTAHQQGVLGSRAPTSTQLRTPQMLPESQQPISFRDVNPFGWGDSRSAIGLRDYARAVWAKDGSARDTKVIDPVTGKLMPASAFVENDDGSIDLERASMLGFKPQ